VTFDAPCMRPGLCPEFFSSDKRAALNRPFPASFIIIGSTPNGTCAAQAPKGATMSIIYDFKTVNQSAKDISSHTFDWMENRSHADDANGGFGAPGPPPRKRSRGSASVDPHPSVPTRAHSTPSRFSPTPRRSWSRTGNFVGTNPARMSSE